MKKKLLLAICLVLVLGIGISVAIFSASGEKTDTSGEKTDDTIRDLRAAAQAYKQLCDADISFDIDIFGSDGHAIVGYYKEIPITRDQVIYKQAWDRAQRKFDDPTWRNPEKTEKELIFEVAKDLYTIEQAKDLGLYPSEEEMKEAFVSETESFQKKLEENLELCSQIGYTQDELIAWMTQQRIESMAKTKFMGQVLTSFLEDQEVEDEVLAELVQAFVAREEGTDLLLTTEKLIDRYLTLQVGDQITYVNEDAGEESNVVPE